MNSFHRNRTNRTFVVLLAILAASVVLTHFWVAQPEFFPLSSAVSTSKLMNYLVNWYNPQNEIQLAQIQSAAGLFIGVCLFGMLALLANAALRCMYSCCKKPNLKTK